MILKQQKLAQIFITYALEYLNDLNLNDLISRRVGEGWRYQIKSKLKQHLFIVTEFSLIFDTYMQLGHAKEAEVVIL